MKPLLPTFATARPQTQRATTTEKMKGGFERDLAAAHLTEGKMGLAGHDAPPTGDTASLGLVAPVHPDVVSPSAVLTNFAGQHPSMAQPSERGLEPTGHRVSAPAFGAPDVSSPADALAQGPRVGAQEEGGPVNLALGQFEEAVLPSVERATAAGPFLKASGLTSLASSPPTLPSVQPTPSPFSPAASLIAQSRGVTLVRDSVQLDAGRERRPSTSLGVNRDGRAIQGERLDPAQLAMQLEVNGDGQAILGERLDPARVAMRIGVNGDGQAVQSERLGPAQLAMRLGVNGVGGSIQGDRPNPVQLERDLPRPSTPLGVVRAIQGERLDHAQLAMRLGVNGAGGSIQGERPNPAQVERGHEARPSTRVEASGIGRTAQDLRMERISQSSPVPGSASEQTAPANAAPLPRMNAAAPVKRQPLEPNPGWQQKDAPAPTQPAAPRTAAAMLPPAPMDAQAPRLAESVAPMTAARQDDRVARTPLRTATDRQPTLVGRAQNDAEVGQLAQQAVAPGVAPAQFIIDTKPTGLKAEATRPAKELAVAAQVVTLETVTARAVAAPETQRVTAPSARTTNLRAQQERVEREPIPEEKRRLKEDAAVTPHAPPVPLAPRPTELVEPVAAAPVQVPTAFEPLLAQITDDPSLRISLMPNVARMSLDTGDAGGRVHLQLKVNDGIAEVRATGPGAHLIELRQNELRVALAQEGLAMGHFDLAQSGGQQHQERPEAPLRDPWAAPRPAINHHVASATDGHLHVKA